jgi:hypothetical protein
MGKLMLKLTEDEARGLDAIYKGVGVLAIVLGGAWTLTEHFLHRAEERETASIEARKPFLEKRLQVYSDLVLAASTISGSDDRNEVEKAKKQFRALNSGILFVFEDGEVARTVRNFATCMDDSGKCGMPINVIVQNLALACRKSIGEEWGVRPNPPANVFATTR